jgi:hypothetical protein
MRWFQDIDCATPFGNYLPPNGAPETGINPLSTDFSLQLSESIQNFCSANPNAAPCPPPPSNTNDGADKAAEILGGTRKRMLKAAAKPHVVQPIVRDVPDAHPRR